MQKLSLKQNLLWNTIGCLIYQGCQWLTTILVVIMSSTYENSGALAFAMATGNVYTAVSTYNMRTVQVSDIKEEFSSRVYVGFRLVTVLASFLLFVLFAFVVSPTQLTLMSMLAFLLFKSDESFANVLYGIDQKAYRMDFIGISQALRGILSIAFFSICLAFFDSLPLAIVGMFLSCAIITLFYDIPHSRRLASITPLIDKKACRVLLVKCAPVVITIIFYGLVATITRQYYGITQGEEMLGIYAAVATPCVLVQVMANYLYSPFLTPLSEKISTGNMNAFRKSLIRLIAALFALILLVILAVAFFGPMLLNIVFGSSIQNYSWMITPATIAASFMTIDYFLTDLFTILRDFKSAVAINMIALTTCLITMVSFINLWDMNGVNMTIIASFATAICFGSIRLIRKKAESVPAKSGIGRG